MATISKRGDLQWQAKIRFKGKTTSRTFSLKSDAERWAREVEVEIEKGIFFSRSASEKTTIGWLIEKYRMDELPKKKGKHFKSSLNRLGLAFGDTTLARLSSEEITDFRNASLKKIGESAVKQSLNLLSSIISLANNEWGIKTPVNPCKSVKNPTEPKGRTRRLVGDEELRLLAAAARSQAAVELVPIVTLAIQTGARQGELLKLRWENIDFDKKTARFVDTKNGDDRTIVLSSIAVAALRELEGGEGGKVFKRWSGGEALNKAFKLACARAGIVGLRFHDLRHEAISRFFEMGLSIIEVSSMSGHKTLDMLKNYGHAKNEAISAKLG